jgi:fumarate reductase flavoprotein subunit
MAMLNEEGISRRNFLGLAGAAGAALAGASMLSGCSPSSADDSASSSEDASDVEPIDALETPSSWDEEADVVVCGTGGGLVAAVRSAELGNKVVVVEKDGTWGGSSKETDIFSVMGTELQKASMAAMGQQLTAAGQTEAGATLSALGELPVETMRQQWYNNYITRPGNGDTGELPDGTEGNRIISGDSELMMAVINGIADSIDWMASDVGINLGPVTQFGSAGYVAGVCPVGSETGGFVSRANYTAFEGLYDKAVELGVEFNFNTPVEALVKDGDAVVGIMATDSDGNERYIKANKGVVMATGGMTQNQDMLKRYVPSVGYRAFNATSSSADTGEGIRMAWGAGADMQGFDSSFCFDGGIDCGSWGHYLYKGDVQLARQPWLNINIQGERLPYYPVDTLGFTHQSGIYMSQPRHAGYVIFDANYEDTIWNWEATGTYQYICRRPMWPEGEGEKTWQTGGNYDRLPEGTCEHDWRIGAQQGIDAGYIFKCDTLDELADKIGMPADKLKAAVDNWNAICEAGVDEQFHLDPAWLVPIQDAPYYGMAVGATVLATNCGVPITTEAQVIGTDGSPIEGLYAVGSVVGGIGGDATYGDCRNPGGGVALSCGTAYMAANAIG